MTLKLKLLLGFCAVLLLTVVVGVWGLRGMDSMESVNQQAATVILGATFLQTAQSEQLRYFLYSTDKSVASVRESLASSRKAFIDVQAMLPETDPARSQLNTLAGQVDTILNSFNELLIHTAALAKVDDDYTIQGRKVLASTNELIEMGYQRQRESLDQGSAALVLLLTNARAQFSSVRYNTWLLATSPTSENLELVLSGIDKYIAMLKDCETHMPQQKNRDVLTRILGELEEYRAFVNKSGQMTMERQKKVLDNGRLAGEAVQKAEAISAKMNAALSLVRQDLTIKLYGVMGVAILAGLMLALLITRNVQGQLGRDPGVLAALARRVTAGDYTTSDDGQPRSGVYADFVGMVSSLREHMDKAHEESERARTATEEAREAARVAEVARVEAQNARREGMLSAAEKLENVVAIVSSASTELAAQIELSEHGADQQSARVAETATAMEQMNVTVLEVARNASTAADVSASTRKKAEAGAEVVRQAVNGIRQVREQSLRLKDDMGKLDENAQAISQIMNVISDIADQTNLLALNAAIEAARAGEAGRGFAVVADEVRKLAEKTMASTTDVARAIQSIQGSAQSSLAQMDRAVASIEEATVFSTQSGEVLSEIVSLADSTADQVRTIATAAEEQSASSEAINQSISHVRVISEETTRAMSEAAHAVSELAEQSQILSRLIDDMKRC